ncbi:MAG: transposase [Ktedonobacteraceae bacterium]|nr:transposase [Ktedonobacteraceae bacterium]
MPELFVFVAVPGVPAHTNLAERNVRPLVVARKISGGTRESLWHLDGTAPPSFPPMPGYSHSTIFLRSSLNSFMIRACWIQGQRCASRHPPHLRVDSSLGVRESVPPETTRAGAGTGKGQGQERPKVGTQYMRREQA